MFIAARSASTKSVLYKWSHYGCQINERTGGQQGAMCGGRVLQCGRRGGGACIIDCSSWWQRGPTLPLFLQSVTMSVDARSDVRMQCIHVSGSVCVCGVQLSA
jgi:hypothetical protein